MKSYACLVFLVCAIAIVLSCDPNGNNEPSCSSENLNVPIRNFWDPTAYWLCTAVDKDADLMQCDDAHLFDSALGQCVLWDEWVWTHPCPNQQ